MAILLEFKYDKRLGLPGYSSHDFGVSMRNEVNNVEEIQEESEKAYRLLQQSVDAQLSNRGFIPAENHTIVARKMIVPDITRLDILTELINRVRAVVLSGKVDINLHWQSLGDEALGSQRMRFLTMELFVALLYK